MDRPAYPPNPMPGSVNPPPGWQPAPSPNKRNKYHPLAILALVVVVGFVAFLGLGLFLVAIGWEADPLDPVETEVAGADIQGAYANANGTTTTWFVVVAEGTTVDELTRIADELVRSSPARSAGDLDIEFFDEDGRQLDNYIDTGRELDQVGSGDDLDIDELFELAEELPAEWLEDHHLGSVSTSLDSGEPTYTLCPAEFGTDCFGDNLIPIG